MINSYLSALNLIENRVKVEFAKQEDLNVRTNDTRTWDFTSGKNNSSKLNGHGKVVCVIQCCPQLISLTTSGN